MMNSINKSPRCARVSWLVPKIGTVLLLAAALIAAQSRIIRPPAQPNSNNQTRRPHVATLRANDSPEGSRVAVTSDQSLNNYEAYRRGDRFYVRIPAADMPRAEATRGRGFADVKTQRSGDSTVVSFRLQPGATAHVEQRSNRLEVVFSVPGGGQAGANAGSNAGREATRPRSNSESASRKPNANKNSNSTSALKSPPANRNANLLASRGTTSSNTNLGSKAGTTTKLSTDPGSKSAPTPSPTPKATPAAKASASPVQKASSVGTPLPANQSTPAAQTNARGSFLSQMKERMNYWILFAQLNPIPVAIGAGVLLLLIGLFVSQRRRARGPRRSRPSRVESRKTKRAAEAAASVAAASESKSDSVPSAAVPVAAAAAGAAVLAASSKKESPKADVAKPDVAKPVAPATSMPVDDARRERVAHVSEEVKNVMAGGEYDESIIGSNDRETRQLVGAELLAALVGRSVPRRERAREAFMKHGYFDDATHDLRIAESSNERAAAARRLSFVHEREATPHLIGALDDPAPDVRRAAVEALMDLRDPAAIGPLNNLMQTENDRKVPRTLIKHAIEACATGPVEDLPPSAASIPAAAIPEAASLPVDSEREVIEL